MGLVSAVVGTWNDTMFFFCAQRQRRAVSTWMSARFFCISFTFWCKFFPGVLQARRLHFSLESACSRHQLFWHLM